MNLEVQKRTLPFAAKRQMNRSLLGSTSGKLPPPNHRGSSVLCQASHHDGGVRLCPSYFHQNKQIRTVSLRRNCSDLFFSLIMRFSIYRREQPNGYSRRLCYYLFAIFLARSIYSLKRSSLRTELNHSQPFRAVMQ